MKKLQAGQLTRLVSLQRRAAGSDALGQPNGSFAEYATAWADIRHRSGMEAIKGDARTSSVQASIRVRYRTDVLAGDRVVHGSTTFEVLAVMPDMQRRDFTDLAGEVVA